MPLRRPLSVRHPCFLTTTIHCAFSIMATTTATQISSTKPSKNARRTNKGRGGNNNGAKGNSQTTVQPVASAVVTPAKIAEEETPEEDVCWICAEPVKYFCVSQCNHRTCHVCALRLRALYKKTDCTFCKVALSSFSPCFDAKQFHRKLSRRSFSRHPKRQTI